MGHKRWRTKRGVVIIASIQKASSLFQGVHTECEYRDIFLNPDVCIKFTL